MGLDNLIRNQLLYKANSTFLCSFVQRPLPEG